MQSHYKQPRILEQIRSVMRLHSFAIHTERSYIDRVKRKIEEFLTH